MKKLKECKNMGELYVAIGEENFGRIAYGLIMAMIIVPLFAGWLNTSMLLDSYRGIVPYDAYEYNNRCMTLWNGIFSLILIWVVIYAWGKISVNKWKIKEFINEIKKNNAWLLWWMALAIWTIIPVLCSVNIRGAIIGTSQLGSGYLSHIYTLGVMGCAYLISDKNQKENIIWAFIGITDILSVIMLSFEYSLPFFGIFTAAPGVSVFTNSNHYGYIITMSYLAVFGMYYKCIYDNETDRCRIKKFVCIISFVVQAFAIVVNDTLGSYLAILFVLIVVPFMWWYKTKKVNIRCFLPLVILLAFTIVSYYGMIYTMLGSSIGQSLVVFFQDLFKVSQKSEGYEHAGTDRIALWIDTINKIKQKPIVGYGPDIIWDKDYNWILWNTPHNEFLECAFFLGIPGLVLYLGGLIHLFISKIKRLMELKTYELVMAGIIIGYLASSFFGVRKFNTACYFFMFVGLLIGKEPKLKKN